MFAVVVHPTMIFYGSTLQACLLVFTAKNELGLIGLSSVASSKVMHQLHSTHIKMQALAVIIPVNYYIDLLENGGHSQAIGLSPRCLILFIT